MEVDVAIIGAGSAGLSAFKEAIKYTKKIALIDRGPLGTTCARIGCMPSKVLIQAANEFYRRSALPLYGITGTEGLNIDVPHLMNHVRNMRDFFVNSVLAGLREFDDYLIEGEAHFVEPYVIAVNHKKIYAHNIIIATGANSIIPKNWQSVHHHILTSENIFEQKSFAAHCGVIGLGAIGLELGQALSRLGVKVIGITQGDFIGGLTDPLVNQSALTIMQQEFPIHLSSTVDHIEKNGKHLKLTVGDKIFNPEQILVTIGHKPFLEDLNLDVFNWPTHADGVPEFNPSTMQIPGHRVFIIGDVNHFHPILHEAADDGRIAGFNATHDVVCFTRRCPLQITFCDPQIVRIGQSFASLDKSNIIIGSINFSHQGRARIMAQNHGLLQIYARKQDGLVLGAEMIAPDGEHLAHLLAWSIQQQMTVFDMLKMPFYHPTVEEGLRTALRDISAQVTQQCSHFELATCHSAAVAGLE